MHGRPDELEVTSERRADRLRVRRRRGGGHAEDRGAAERLQRPPDEEVVGAEVVPPHAHAVHLVHDHEADADLAERLHERLLPESLGRRVEDPRLAGRDGAKAGRGLLGRERRVHEGGRGGDSRRELVHLVLHQRDERREDEGRRGAEHRGELVRERLAGAGRHQGERVPALDGRADDELLTRPKVVEAEEILQRMAELRHPNKCTRAVGAHLCRLRAIVRPVSDLKSDTGRSGTPDSTRRSGSSSARRRRRPTRRCRAPLRRIRRCRRRARRPERRRRRRGPRAPESRRRAPRSHRSFRPGPPPWSSTRAPRPFRRRPACRCPAGAPPASRRGSRARSRPHAPARVPPASRPGRTRRRAPRSRARRRRPRRPLPQLRAQGRAVAASAIRAARPSADPPAPPRGPARAAPAAPPGRRPRSPSQPSPP